MISTGTKEPLDLEDIKPHVIDDMDMVEQPHDLKALEKVLANFDTIVRAVEVDKDGSGKPDSVLLDDGTTKSFEQASAFAVTEQFGFDSATINGTPTFQLPYFGTGNILHFRGNSSDRATQITYSINGNAVTDANFSGISSTTPLGISFMSLNYSLDVAANPTNASKVIRLIVNPNKFKIKNNKKR